MRALSRLVAAAASDTGPTQIIDDAALDAYCMGVAGTVGVMMCVLFEIDEKWHRPAADLGKAMQLTNICRGPRRSNSGGRAVAKAGTQVRPCPRMMSMLPSSAAAPLVAVLGVPHGALDLPIAEALWPLDGWGKKARFALVHLGLAVVVLGLWSLFPGAALALFLVYSAVHFSGDWAAAALLQRWTGGAATVAAPAVFRDQEVADIFGFLVPPDAAILVATGLGIVGGATLSVFVISLLLRPAFRTPASLDQIGLWVATACLAPLAYFIVYFCALHSVRHFTQAMAFIKDRSRALYLAGLVSTATLLAALAGFLYLQQFGTPMVEGSILRVVFIGLAALTVPHTILMDRFHSAEPQLA